MTVLDGTIPAYWTEAECNTGDASLLDAFYPERPSSTSYNRARAICAACPVSAECLAAALAEEGTTGLRDGMRAGLTPDERHRIARSAAR